MKIFVYALAIGSINSVFFDAMCSNTVSLSDPKNIEITTNNLINNIKSVDLDAIKEIAQGELLEYLQKGTNDCTVYQTSVSELFDRLTRKYLILKEVFKDCCPPKNDKKIRNLYEQGGSLFERYRVLCQNSCDKGLKLTQTEVFELSNCVQEMLNYFSNSYNVLKLDPNLQGLNYGELQAKLNDEIKKPNDESKLEVYEALKTFMTSKDESKKCSAWKIIKEKYPEKADAYQNADKEATKAWEVFKYLTDSVKLAGKTPLNVIPYRVANGCFITDKYTKDKESTEEIFKEWEEEMTHN